MLNATAITPIVKSSDNNKIPPWTTTSIYACPREFSMINYIFDLAFADDCATSRFIQAIHNRTA